MKNEKFRQAAGYFTYTIARHQDIQKHQMADRILACHLDI